MATVSSAGGGTSMGNAQQGTRGLSARRLDASTTSASGNHVPKHNPNKRRRYCNT